MKRINLAEKIGEIIGSAYNRSTNTVILSDKIDDSGDIIGRLEIERRLDAALIGKEIAKKGVAYREGDRIQNVRVLPYDGCVLVNTLEYLDQLISPVPGRFGIAKRRTEKCHDDIKDYELVIEKPFDKEVQYFFDGKSDNWQAYTHKLLAVSRDLSKHEIKTVGKRILETYRTRPDESRALRNTLSREIESGNKQVTREDPAYVSFNEYRNSYVMECFVEEDGIHIKIAGASFTGI